MKNSKISLLFLFLIFCQMSAQAQDHIQSEKGIDLYLAPVVGSTSLTNSNGSENRTKSFSYGAESMIFYKHLGASINYLGFTASDEGTEAIHVTQENKWLTFEAKYRLWNQDMSPYLSLGAGPMFKTLSTAVMGQTDKESTTEFLYDIGPGFFDRFADNFGFNFSIKYFQYFGGSGFNYNGFNFIVSLGYILPGLF